MFLVDTEDKLNDLLKNINEEMESVSAEDRFLAVDTEFIRENLEIPLLCLIQMATPSIVYLIDTIAINVAPLNNIFSNPDIMKVFHSAEQDLEMLKLSGIDTQNFYDTQLYESILSTDSCIGYQSIVFRYLDKKLKKNHCMSNWRKRPLSRKQLEYSANDVFYLRDVYKIQLKKLIQLNRKNWLIDELRQMKEKSNNPQSMLNETDQIIYQQLVEWRNNYASEMNISTKSIANNNILNAICKKGVDFIQSVKNSRNIKNKNYKKFLIFAEKIAIKVDVKKKPDNQSDVISLLKTFLEIRSRNCNVANTVIATSKDLERLVNGERDVKCLSGWRNEIFGNDALQLLDGKIALRIDGTKIIME
ncbi:MAG: hypothetical protein LBB21_04435 [Holosporaceae bacterium]|jgi:ribonuclease D|nr:hypothetical protein [Holosporaceae bacterium]